MANDSVHVLVVDDDRAIQRMLADDLARQGFAVTVERDGEWALKTFEMKHFDVVLLDLLLPAINGYEVASKIRELPQGQQVPIVMISGIYKTEAHRQEAVDKYGAFGFLEKPFKLSDLHDLLKQALGERYPEQVEPDGGGASATEPTLTEKLADRAAEQELEVVERTTRTASGSVDGIKGDFKHKSFPEVLAEVYRWRATGAVLLRRTNVKKIVYFREGRPQFVKSNLLSECLGRVMVRERMISEAECEESLKRMKASSRQQGTVLIEMGCISPHNLSYALNLQLRAKLFDVFAWRDGDFQFNKRVELPSEAVNLDLSTAAIIHEGVRRTYDAPRLKAWIADAEHRYVHPSSDPLLALQECGLGEEEQLVLEACDGRKTLPTLRALDLLPSLETDRLIFAMTCAQVLELHDEPADGKASMPFAFHAAVTAPQHLPPPLRSHPPPLKKSRPPPLPAMSQPLTKVEVPWRGDSLPGLGGGPDDARTDRLPRIELFPELDLPGASNDNDDRVLRERLAAHAAAMRKMDYFEVLGVPTTAPTAQVEQAYLYLARENHPDKVASSSSGEVRKLAQQIYDLIARAHATLIDPDERGKYLQDIKAGIKREMGEDVGKILTAEGKFQRGQEALEQNQLSEAFQLFEEAVTLYGDEGEFHAYLGWTRFQLDGKAAEAALHDLEKAITLNPKSDKGYLFSGHVYKAMGKTQLAEKQFEKAIQANPGCTEALRELSILNWAARLGGGKRR